MRIHLLIFLMLIINIFCISHPILNCEIYDKDTKTCEKCKDKHFLFYNDLFCLPCDDKNYGQIGCEGNCDSSRYENDRFAYCEEDKCKEGYYNLGGLCLKCDTTSQGCKTCKMVETQNEDGTSNKKFVCEECLSDEYKMDQNGQCKKCQINNCLKCRFRDDNSEQECLQCESNYYISSDKTCNKCHENIHIDYGICSVCSDNTTDLSNAKCSCYSQYFLNENNTCNKYVDYCSKYILGKDKIPFCLICESGKYLKENQCLNCPEGCSSCYLDNYNHLICTYCDSDYTLIDGKCEKCCDGCNRCLIKKNNKTSCSSCEYYHYAFNSNKTCTACSSINYLGIGCNRCQFNEISNKYECLQCYQNYVSGNQYNSYYAYIRNQFKCLNNYDSDQIYLYGCLEANYLENDKYKCLKCLPEFTLIQNDKICKKSSEINLSNSCLEVINIGDITNPIYSCNKCSDDTVLIIDLNNFSDCFARSGNLAYCSKGKKDSTSNILCNECVSLAHLDESNENTICKCNFDSFGKNNLFCYKCDDPIKGNPGCESSEGCEYRSVNDQLNCNKCKDNFFEFTEGQCFSCSNEVEFCDKCHLDENDQFICDKCLDNFVYNKYEQTCQLICEEFPDISPGCIICNEEYKAKGKCQACKPGYFKTENESCIYCRSEKYGGPACNKCMRSENNEDIICVDCEGKNKVLNSKGKCYFSPNDLMKNCEIFKFIKEENSEKLVCAFCKGGFYLDNDRNCINFTNNLEKRDNCYGYYYNLENLSIYYSSNSYFYYDLYDKGKSYYFHFNNNNDNYNYDHLIMEKINENLRTINYTVKGQCQSCNDGYYLNLEKNCIPIKVENCTISSMIKNNNIYYGCRAFCRVNQFPLVILKNNSYNQSSFITISELYDKIYYYNNIFDEQNPLLNITLCINNSDDNENNHLKNCILAEYIENEKKYKCHLCKNYYYFLYEETNQCIEYDNNFNCQYENIGNQTNPIYSCKKCRPNRYYSDNNYYSDYYYNYQFMPPSEYADSSYYSLVREGNINFCVSDSSLDKCLSATVDTSYFNNKYNCTSCLINHLPYDSRFYERYICQNILSEIKKSQSVDLNQYQHYYKIEAINEDCPNNTLFTPDGKYCYKCNQVMYGCKSQCSFSLERNDIIKCLDGCIDGYIESSEGICQYCSNINDGCYKCHYGEYEVDYFGIKRKRKFICDQCYNSDYYVLKDDKCTRCYNIESGCDRCSLENNEFKCKQCSNSYYLDDRGHCNYCNSGFILENKCIKCDDLNKGGIEGCNYCNFNGNKVSCSYCNEGYTLIKNNNTCLKTSENNEFYKYNKCSEVRIENNKIHCLKCKDSRYSVLKGNNESICIYLPELNGYFEDDYSNENDLSYYEKNPDIDHFYKYYFAKYFDYYYYFYHCIEVVNIGSEDNPLYSCTKCYDWNYLYTEEKSNISYCLYSENYIDNKEYVQNCREKKIKIIDKVIKFTCISCNINNNILVYDEIDKVTYCKEPIIEKISTTEVINNIPTTSQTTTIPTNIPTTIQVTSPTNNIPTTNSISTTNKIRICMAKKCKKCKSDDEYFCEVCELENYVINNITGACIEKIEAPPAITWKDIFRLEMNSEKEINGKTIKGPKLNLRGETNSQINSGHAFIIYLIFKLKQPLNIRNLEDEKDTIKIKAICEIKNEVSENKNDTNNVEYECIGDSQEKDLSKYTLDDIDTGNDSSNLNELKSHKNLLEIENGPTYEFTMEKIQNQTSKDYNFNFTIEGKIDINNLKKTEIKGKFRMNEIKDTSDCIFKIEENKKANLNCELNVEEYKNIKSFSFNTTKIEYKNEYNISLADLNKIYLINVDDDKKKNKNKNGIIIGVVIGGIIIAISLALLVIFLIKKKQKSIYENVEKKENCKIIFNFDSSGN